MDINRLCSIRWSTQFNKNITGKICEHTLYLSTFRLFHRCWSVNRRVLLPIINFVLLYRNRVLQLAQLQCWHSHWPSFYDRQSCWLELHGQWAGWTDKCNIPIVSNRIGHAKRSILWSDSDDIIGIWFPPHNIRCNPYDIL